MTAPIKAPKKLIEVALPLDDINAAAAREKSIRHGHPSTLHLWWARRPLAAARAVLFAQLVNDPSEYIEGDRRTKDWKQRVDLERLRLFQIIRELVKWENTNNETVLKAARAEIRKSWEHTCRLNAKHPEAAKLFDPAKLPAFHDPFAGGGAIPLEAQRLGLEANASDLNPVAVLINKAMIEIPPKFAGRAPVGPIPKREKQPSLTEDWAGAKGLAEDVRRYGHWMRQEAEKRIGHLYPQVEITEEMAEDRPDLRPLVGQKLTTIAWLWARTVRSPNPAYSGAHVPLASTFLLSTKPGRNTWVEPEFRNGRFHFHVRAGSKAPNEATNGTRVGKAKDFLCSLSRTPIPRDYIRAEAKAGRMHSALMAVVAEGKNGRVYLSNVHEAEAIAASASTFPAIKEARDTFLSGNTPTRAMITGGVCSAYGLETWGHLFTDRQVLLLTTLTDLLSDLASDVRKRMDSDQAAIQYANALSVYLSLAIGRTADRGSALCSWDSSPKMEALRNTFGRQALPMVWDFAEGNPFSASSGSWNNNIDWICRVIERLPANESAHATQALAQDQKISDSCVVSTDPPYYDNIGYADLSDFFYPWLRRAQRRVYPDLFATSATPKGDELVATVYRHGSKTAADAFFLSGMTSAFSNLARRAHESFPVTVYYAFKQSETKDAGTASTGWETFLAAVLRAGFALVGTWPMRTELGNRMVSSGTNALASSIILVCRRRATDAASISRKEFLRELKVELAEALDAMLGGERSAAPIAPVDLAQAAIGPGMAVFSRYSAVLEANGEPMSVHTALTLINKQVDEVLGGENFDADTNFCLGWFQDMGWSAGDFGKANTLAQAKATSVTGVAHSGVIRSGGGKVRLLRPDELPADWDPRRDNHTPVWEALHQLIRALADGGESAAGALLARMPERSADIRRLAYWLYTLCAERKGWAEEARRYNELITAWHGLEAAAHEAGELGAQGSLDI